MAQAPQHIPQATVPEIAKLQAAGWSLDKHGKWWNAANDSGARYCNTPRAFRYIAEDFGPSLGANQRHA